MRRGEVTNERGEGKGPFAPSNIHIRTHLNLAVTLKDVISNLLFTSSSSSLGFSSLSPLQHPIPILGVFFFFPSWTAATPPAPPPPHRPLNRRLPHGAPPQRAAGARPAVAAPTAGDASGADGATRFRAGGCGPNGREGGGSSSSSSLKLRETSSSAPLDFELRGSIARLPAKNSSNNNSRMPISALAPGGVTEA